MSKRKTTRIDVIGQNGNDGEHYPPACAHQAVSVLMRKDADGVARTCGLKCTQCGMEWTNELRGDAGAAYVQRQTARRLMTGVARELEREAEVAGRAGEDHRAGVCNKRASNLRDALALLVGD